VCNAVAAMLPTTSSGECRYVPNNFIVDKPGRLPATIWVLGTGCARCACGQAFWPCHQSVIACSLCCTLVHCSLSSSCCRAHAGLKRCIQRQSAFNGSVAQCQLHCSQWPSSASPLSTSSFQPVTRHDKSPQSPTTELVLYLELFGKDRVLQYQGLHHGAVVCRGNNCAPA
jgi:hypothetical protein